VVKLRPAVAHIAWDRVVSESLTGKLVWSVIYPEPHLETEDRRLPRGLLPERKKILHRASVPRRGPLQCVTSIGPRMF
jgi:hypothetical protein